MLVIPALGRLRQKDQEFSGSLGYMESGRENGFWMGNDSLAPNLCSQHAASFLS
jgi:hypothetical protein